MAWIKVPYINNLNRFVKGKKTKFYYKTFKVQPLGYANLRTNKINVMFTDGPGNIDAAYDERHNRIDVFMPELLDSTIESIRKGDTDRIDYLLKLLQTDIHHELIHFLQFNTEHSIGGKTDMYQKYEELKEDYYISPIEYKTQLLNEVQDFKIDGLSDVKSFLNESVYFTALKNRAPKRYQKAVRDFYSLLYRNS